VVKANRITDVPASTVDIYPTLLDLLDIKVDHQPVLDGVSLLPLIEGKSFERTKPQGFWVYPEGGIPRRSDELLAQMMRERREGIAPAVDVSKDGTVIPPYPQAPPFDGHAVWMDGRWKLHQIPGGRRQAGTFKYELYDLVADRAETNDVAAENADRVKTMSQALETWQRSVANSLNGGDY
jgi:arylsulfatase A-like enzyme